MVRFVAGLLVSLALLSAAYSVEAAVFTVTKTDDTNDGTCNSDCSLREAVGAAGISPADDVILFDPIVFSVPQTITLVGGEIVIGQGGGVLTVSGPGFQKLTISGGNTSRIFTVSRATANFSGITFTGGNGAGAADSGRGGALYNFGGTTVVTDSVFNGNTANLGGALNNAASNSPTPAVPSTLTIINCTISNNTASSSGGAIQNFSTSTITILNSTFTGNTSNGGVGGGAIAANGGLRISNSTFTGNTSTTDPGGAIQTNGTLGTILTNVTITGNTAATSGGGLHRGTTNTNFSIRNSIIAGNTGGASPDVSNSAGGLTSQGNNIIGVTGTSTGWIGTDLLNTDPLVAPLGSYGGVVRTQALLEGSPAINAGQNCVLDLTCSAANPPFAITHDSRYFKRTNVDIGAYEVVDGSIASLPNAGLGQAYSHLITNNPTGFVYTTSGDAPPNITLTSTASDVTLTGTPSAAGTWIFTVTVASSTIPSRTRSQLYSFNASSDPNNAVLLVRYLNAPYGSTMVHLTDLVGRPRVSTLGQFGVATFTRVPVGGAYFIEARNRRGNLPPAVVSILGSYTVTIDTSPTATLDTAKDPEK